MTKFCLTADRDSVYFDASDLDLDLKEVSHITASDIRRLNLPELQKAAAAFRGRFLEGLELPQCPLFEAWRAFHDDAINRTKAIDPGGAHRAAVERTPARYL